MRLTLPKPGSTPAKGGFWEVATAAHIDWPQQSRVIDLVDNLSGARAALGSAVAIGLRSRELPAPGNFAISAARRAELSVRARATEGGELQEFSRATSSSDQRGTQDSNLESPVLETDDTGLNETGASE